VKIELVIFLLPVALTAGFFIGRWWAQKGPEAGTSTGTPMPPSPIDWNAILPKNLSEEQRQVLRKTLPGYNG